MEQVPEFLKTIPQEHLLYSVVDGKKRFDERCFNKKYTYEQCDALRQDGQEIGVMYYIRDTPYAVVDIDSNDYTHEQLLDDTDIDSCFVDGNTKGQHIWCAMKNKTAEHRKNKVDCGVFTTMDWLGEKVFERCGKKWTYDVACYIDDHHINKAYVANTFEKKTSSAMCGFKNNAKTDDDTYKKFVELIDTKYCDARSDWTKIVLAMKKCGLSFDYADAWSKKSSKYTADGIETLWNSYAVEQITATEGTLRYYAKHSNPEKYKKLKCFGNDWFNMNLTEYLTHLDSLTAEPSEDEILPDNFEDLGKPAQRALKQKQAIASAITLCKTIKIKQKFFEQNHAKVNNPPTFIRIVGDDISIIKAEALQHIYAPIRLFTGDRYEDFTQIWKRQIDIKTYNSVNFHPPPSVCPRDVYNSFNGLRSEKIVLDGERTDTSIFTNHIKILTNHDEKGTEYLMNYLAHMVQQPGSLVGVSLVFQSEQGTGKSVFWEKFGKYILGEQHLVVTTDIQKFVGRFPMIRDRLLGILDEASGKDTFASSDKLKGLITEEVVAIETKGIDGVKVQNFMRMIMLSNSGTPARIESSDRRYVVYKCSTERKNDRDYIGKLVGAFKDDNQSRSFYELLMERDISKWDMVAERPFTKAYADIKSATIPPLAMFFDEHIIRYKNGSSQIKEDMLDSILAKDAFKLYTFWLKENFPKFEITLNKFSRDMTEWAERGITKHRNSNGQVYKYDFDKLEKYLISEGWITDN